MAKRRHVKNPGVPGTAGGGGAGPTGGGYSTRDLVYVFDARANVRDGVGNPVTAGNPVITWEPVYGSEALTQAAPASQPTLATNPINGLAAIDFSTDFLAGATTKLGGATSWEETCIIVWASGVTPTPVTLPSSYSSRGLFGWANNSGAGGNGLYYHFGCGLAQGYITALGKEYLFAIVGDGAAVPVNVFAQGEDLTQTATNVHINAQAYTAVSGGGPTMIEDYTGAAGPAGVTVSVGAGSPANRTSSNMSCGAYVTTGNPNYALDGQIQAIYLWKRALPMAELSRTVGLIAGTWRG